MCFHLSNTKKATKVEDTFKARFEDANVYDPYYHFNGWENKSLYIIKQDETHLIEPAYWGVMPEDYSIKKRSDFLRKTNTLNARNDNLYSSRLYSQFIEYQRCLVIAEGFFEPHHYQGVSYPYYIKPQNNGLIAFAGIYSETLEGDFTASIITTTANNYFEEIHNRKSKKGDYRMPLILDQVNYDNWLDVDLNEPGVKELLKSFTKSEFVSHPVSRDLFSNKINSNRANILNEVPYKLNTLF